MLEALIRSVGGDSEWRDHVSRAAFGSATPHAASVPPSAGQPMRQPIAAKEDTAEWAF
ncbi:hypothetical protein [Microbacterium suaedae]|uniref:hypothetical protein n=1 Tax=Microbacterium suaedae TaxID=2067813 RepID=UPI0013A63E92|nr:hypothetical protein [Microbacterium suaedae]